MIIVSVSVNNETLGGISIQRTSRMRCDVDVYAYQYEVDIGGDTPCRRKGLVDHSHSDGALELIRKVIDIATLKVEE